MAEAVQLAGVLGIELTLPVALRQLVTGGGVDRPPALPRRLWRAARLARHYWRRHGASALPRVLEALLSHLCD